MITKKNHNFNIATQSNLDQKRVDSVLFYQPGSGFDIKETKLKLLPLPIGEEETEFHNIKNLSFKIEEEEIRRISLDIGSFLRDPSSIMYLKTIDQNLGKEMLNRGIVYEDKDYPQYFIAGKGHFIPGPPPNDYKMRKQNGLLDKLLLEEEEKRGVNVEGYTPRFIGFVDSNKANEFVASGRTFSEDMRTDGLIFHGKYSHRLQLAMLMTASEQGVLNFTVDSLGEKSLSQSQLMELLVKVECNYVRYGVKNNLWEDLLDSASDHLDTLDYAREIGRVSASEDKHKQQFDPKTYSYSNSFPATLNSNLMFLDGLSGLRNLGNYLRNSHYKVAAQMCLEAQKISGLENKSFHELYTSCMMYQSNDGLEIRKSSTSKISLYSNLVRKNTNYNPVEFLNYEGVPIQDDGIRKKPNSNDSDKKDINLESPDEYMTRKKSDKKPYNNLTQQTSEALSSTSVRNAEITSLNSKNHGCCVIS